MPLPQTHTSHSAPPHTQPCTHAHTYNICHGDPQTCHPELHSPQTHTSHTYSYKLKLSHTYTCTYNMPSQKPSDIHLEYILVSTYPALPGPRSRSPGLPSHCEHGPGAGTGSCWALWINPGASWGQCPILRSRQSAARRWGR